VPDRVVHQLFVEPTSCAPTRPSRSREGGKGTTGIFRPSTRESALVTPPRRGSAEKKTTLDRDDRYRLQRDCGDHRPHLRKLRSTIYDRAPLLRGFCTSRASLFTIRVVIRVCPSPRKKGRRVSEERNHEPCSGRSRASCSSLSAARRVGARLDCLRRDDQAAMGVRRSSERGLSHSGCRGSVSG